MKEGIKGVHEEEGTQQQVWKSLTWGMLNRMEVPVRNWGVGGKVNWIGLALTYLMLLRASGLFAEDDEKVHDIYCLIGEGAAF